MRRVAARKNWEVDVAEGLARIGNRGRHDLAGLRGGAGGVWSRKSMGDLWRFGFACLRRGQANELSVQLSFNCQLEPTTFRANDGTLARWHGGVRVVGLENGAWDDVGTLVVTVQSCGN